MPFKDQTAGISTEQLSKGAVAVLVYPACGALLFAFQRALLDFPQPSSPAIGALMQNLAKARCASESEFGL